MRKSWVTQALGKRGPSASYVPYQAKKTQNIDSQGPSTNPLPAGNRIGPKNKVSSFKGGKGNEVNATVDARIGKGPKVGFDPGAKRVPFTPSPTSERASSGRKGPPTYTRGK